jgi:SAM-dependent MidA family methyltransferase
VKNLTIGNPARDSKDVVTMSFIHNYLKDMDLSFKDFMELALYHPAYGYYSRPENRVQTSGDYVTAATISPVFGFALGRLASEFVERAGDGMCAIVDIGCGDGGLLRSIVEQAHPRVRERAVFHGIDRSLSRVTPEARALGIHFADSVDALPRDVPILAISNELFDAFPFARLVGRGDEIHELWVTQREESLDWTEREASFEYADYFAARGIELLEGQFADVALEWSR